MSELDNRLTKLSDLKLIDLVKNYRQYNYDESVRNDALSILRSRGIDEEYLKLTGNFTNNNYEKALRIMELYSYNSYTAFVLYLLSLIMPFFVLLFSDYSEILGWFFVLLLGLVFLFFNIYFLKSLINFIDFYKSIDKYSSFINILIFLLIGYPLFFILHFYYKKEMKENLKYIK